MKYTRKIKMANAINWLGIEMDLRSEECWEDGLDG